jgi:hypothetical protein
MSHEMMDSADPFPWRPFLCEDFPRTMPGKAARAGLEGTGAGRVSQDRSADSGNTPELADFFGMVRTSLNQCRLEGHLE